MPTTKKKKPARPDPSDGKRRRVVADVPEHIFLALHVRCLQRNISMREYLLELMAKDGIR